MRLFDSLGLVVQENPGAVKRNRVVSNCRGGGNGICGGVMHGGCARLRVGYLSGVGERVRSIFYVFHDLYRIGNEFAKRLAFGVPAAGNRKVGAARKADAAQACGRIVEHHEAYLAHPFFGAVARVRHERFVISVDGNCRHFRSGGQLFEQSIVAHAVHLFGGNICEVTAE